MLSVIRSFGMSTRHHLNLRHTSQDPNFFLCSRNGARLQAETHAQFRSIPDRVCCSAASQHQLKSCWAPHFPWLKVEETKNVTRGTLQVLVRLASQALPNSDTRCEVVFPKRQHQVACSPTRRVVVIARCGMALAPD